MQEESSTSSSLSKQEGSVQFCNGIACSFVIACPALVWVGYRFTAAYGFPLTLLGAVGGFIAGILMAPLLFFLFAIFAHFVIKVQEIFRPPES